MCRGLFACLKMQWIRIGILTGSALREREYRLEGKARYVNVQGSVDW